MKKLLIAVLAAASLTGHPGARAHGAGEPKHGGVVQSASDLAFELVARPDGATIYMDDHDKPFATEGASGKLTVLSGGRKSEAELTAAGDNRLEAKGVKLASGSKVVAAVTLPGQKVVTVRFIVR